MKKCIQIFILLLAVCSMNVAFAESYSCETVDGAYYGKDGSEVDKVQYEKECTSHNCEIVGDTYYGKNGDSVSEEVFEDECDANVVTEFPDTASKVSPTEIFFAILGSVFLLGSIILSITYRRISD